MSEDDPELKRIRMRLLRELTAASSKRRGPKPKRNALEVLESRLKGRGQEVLDAALSQHPRETMEVVKILASMIEQGKLRDSVDGSRLYTMLRRLGIRVKLETEIAYLRNGKKESIKDMFRSE